MLKLDGACVSSWKGRAVTSSVPKGLASGGVNCTMSSALGDLEVVPVPHILEATGQLGRSTHPMDVEGGRCRAA